MDALSSVRSKRTSSEVGTTDRNFESALSEWLEALFHEEYDSASEIGSPQGSRWPLVL